MIAVENYNNNDQQFNIHDLLINHLKIEKKNNLKIRITTFNG